ASTTYCYYKCSNGYNRNGSSCIAAATCGNGSVGAGETCDDSNTNNGDGCNSTCQRETRSYACSGLPVNTTANTASSITQICGASNSSSCTSRSPSTTYSYNASASTTYCYYKCSNGYNRNGSSCIAAATCGNGSVGAGEQCDDSNTNNGDGCNSTCQRETKSADCIGLIASSKPNTASSITQTCGASNGSSCTSRSPSTTYSYNTSPSSSQCLFKCEDGFSYSLGKCLLPTTQTGNISTTGDVTFVGAPIIDGASMPLSNYIIKLDSPERVAVPNVGDKPVGTLTIGASVNAIKASGGTRDKTLQAVKSISSEDVRAANLGETGIPSEGTIYTTIEAGSTGVSLLPIGGNFFMQNYIVDGTPGTTLTIYRSSDGINRSINNPDTTCTLDANLMCSFYTDHLTTFGFWGSLSNFNIANGAAYINDANVTLNNNVPKAKQMRFSNNGSSRSSLVTYATTYPWTMTALAANSGYQPRTVYARFYSGIVYSGTSDTIIGDTKPPTMTAPFLGAGKVSGIYYSSSAPVYAVSRIADTTAINLGGCGMYYLSAGWVSYSLTTGGYDYCYNTGAATTYFENLYSFAIQFQAMDQAGNATISSTGTFYRDDAGPHCTISINNGATYATGRVSLYMYCTDYYSTPFSDQVGGAGTTRIGFGDISHGGLTWADYDVGESQLYLTGYDISGQPDGTVTLYVQGLDVIGNTGSSASDTIIKVTDTTPPVLTESMAVSTPTNDTTPDYEFDSTEAGEISYSGDCSSSTTTAVGNGTTSITFNTLAQGTHSNCLIRVRDAANNTSNPLSVSAFTIDTTPPAAPTCTPANGTYFSGSLAVTCTPTDGTIKYTTNGTTPTCGSPTRSNRSFTGTTILKVSQCDAAYNITTTPNSYTYYLDNTPPVGGTFKINNDTGYTNNTTVTLTSIDCGSDGGVGGIIQMAFGNSSNPGSNRQSCSSSVSHTLSAGDGTKTVYMRFRDSLGNTTTSDVIDSIILDTARPNVSANNNGVWWNTDIPITLSVDDTYLAIAKYRRNVADCRNGTSFTNLQIITGNTEGTNTLYLCASDQGGNTNTWTGIYYLDKTKPTGTISINGGAAQTNSATTTLTLSGTDTNGVTQMKFSCNNSTYSVTETYGTSKSWNITNGSGCTAGDGTKTVYVQYKDTPGNRSTATISDTIVLDTTAPVPPTCTASQYFCSSIAPTCTPTDGTIKYTTNGTTPTCGSTSRNTPTFTVTTTLKVSQCDTAGNISVTPNTYTYTKDTSGPSMGTSNGSIAEANQCDVSISSVSDGGIGGAVQYSCDGATYSGWSSTVNCSAGTQNEPSGPTIKTVYSKDSCGNISSAGPTCTWTNVTPTVNAVSNSANEGSTVLLTSNASDPGGTTFSYQWYS
ncbi:MAG: DUF4215 domain-containing protein, partial [Candidatus Absconditicoccaceae bacterium]